MGILTFKASVDGENTAKLLVVDEEGSPITAANGKQAVFELRGIESKGFKAAKHKADKAFMDTLSGKNKKLTELVSKHYPEFLKIEEYTDWAGLKETLIITKTGHVVNSDGEIIDWMTGVEYPDEIKAKGKG